MKGKLKSLGFGAMFSLISATAVALLAAAVLILYKLVSASGYTAVLAFAIAVVCLVSAIRIMYGIGACIKNVEK